MFEPLVSLLFLSLSDEPSPPRDAPLTFVSTRPLIEIQACAVRKLAHSGSPLSVPAEGGVDIDFSQPKVWNVANEARYSLRIRESGGSRVISAVYRHPFSRKAADNMTRSIAKRCFPEGIGR